MAINVHYAYTFEENIEIIKYSYLEVMIKQTTSLYVKYIILYATQLSMLIQVEMYMSSEHIRSKTVISKYKSEKKKNFKAKLQESDRNKEEWSVLHLYGTCQFHHRCYCKKFLSERERR